MTVNAVFLAFALACAKGCQPRVFRHGHSRDSLPVPLLGAVRHPPESTVRLVDRCRNIRCRPTWLVLAAPSRPGSNLGSARVQVPLHGHCLTAMAMGVSHALCSSSQCGFAPNVLTSRLTPRLRVSWRFIPRSVLDETPRIACEQVQRGAVGHACRVGRRPGRGRWPLCAAAHRCMWSSCTSELVPRLERHLRRANTRVLIRGHRVFAARTPAHRYPPHAWSASTSSTSYRELLCS